MANTNSIKVVAAWGQICGVREPAQLGWVMARAEDGSAYLYVGTRPAVRSVVGYLGNDNIRAFPGGVAAFTERVKARRFIDPRYWVQVSGPRAQETTPEYEFNDAND